MEKGTRSILPLPIEAQLQLKSSVALNSLNDVAIGLVKNSLDAQAQTVKVEIDLTRGNCCVQDDGNGVHGAEFGPQGGLGLMHYSSEFGSASETHGRSGRFLASLSALSLLSVSSRHVSESGERSITWHRSQTVGKQCNVQEEERKVEFRHGTTVMVCDLFGNLPVRIKQRASHFGDVHNVGRELDRLKLQMVALILAWPRSVRIVVSDLHEERKRLFALGDKVKSAVRPAARLTDSQITSAFQLDRTCTILSHAGFITPPCAGSWKSLSARTSKVFVRAAVGLEPASTRQIQFVSIGIHPLHSSSSLSSVLYSEVNALFDESAFGTVEEDVDLNEEERIRRLRDRRYKTGDHTERQLKGRAKRLDRWPMFYIRIDARNGDLPEGTLNSDEDDGQAAMFFEKIVQLIRSMMLHFLQEYHLKPSSRKVRGNRQSLVQNAVTNGHLPIPISEQRVRPTSAEGLPENYDDISVATLDRRSGRAVGDGDQARGRTLDSATSFKSWSRVKSGKPRALEDLLCGLPRKKIARQQQDGGKPLPHAPRRCSQTANILHEGLSREHSDPDVELLLQDLDGSHKPEDGNLSRAPEQYRNEAAHLETGLEDAIIPWKNPLTGENVRINARTGLSLPAVALRSTSEPQALHCNTLDHATTGSGASSRTRLLHSNLRAGIQSRRGTWFGDLLEGWQNPSFRLEERPIPSVNSVNIKAADGSSTEACHKKYDHPTPSSNSSQHGRLSKASLEHATVLGQVDKKFILAILAAPGSGDIGERSDEEASDNILVLFDQHAVDERCRVEELYADITKASPARLPRPITFEVTRQETELFRRERGYFETWGVLYEVEGDQEIFMKAAQAGRPASAAGYRRKKWANHSTLVRPASATTTSTATVTLPQRERASKSSPQVTVRSLPMPIAERCRLDPGLLSNILRSDVWRRSESNPRPAPSTDHREADDKARKDGGGGSDNLASEGAATSMSHAWLKGISNCPGGILDLLNSRACRSAIMFNDDLTPSECKDLIRRLARCAFPFQCAHGRPSLTVLGGLDGRSRRGGSSRGSGSGNGEDRVLGPRTTTATKTAKISSSEHLVDDGGGGERNGGQDFLPAFTEWQRTVRDSDMEHQMS